MISIIKKVFISSTAKDSMILLVGSILSTVIGFVLTIILTRNLSPETFGLFITGLTFCQLVADLFEMGLNSMMLNLVPQADNEQKNNLLIHSLTVRLLLSGLVSIIIFTFSSQIALLVFKSLDIESFIKLSGVGVFLLTLIIWGQNAFQSQRRFLPAMLSSISVNVFRFSAVILTLYLLKNYSSLSIYSMVQYGLVIPVILIIGGLKLNIYKVNFSRKNYSHILNFALPVGLAFAIAAIYSRLDQIMVFNLAGAKEAGVYGLAFRVSSSFILAAAALGSALTPRFSSMAKESFNQYFKKSLLASAGLAGCVLLTIPLAPLILPLLFGDKFNSAIIPYQILTLGSIFFIFYSPFYSAILYQHKKTKFTFYLSLFTLIATFLLLNFLIPVGQSVGAAISISLVYLLQMIIAILYYLKVRHR